MGVVRASLPLTDRVGFLIIFPTLTVRLGRPLACHSGLARSSSYGGDSGTMANTYRTPTPEETESYRKAVEEALVEEALIKPSIDRVALAKKAIENILGPCVYKILEDGKCQVTQSTPDENGAQAQFIFSARLA